VAELVDALDLGSSGAIRGGSSPPFGIARSVRLDWRSYETKERDPRLLEKEKGQRPTVVSRSSGGYQDRAATSGPAGENGKASRDIDEVRTTRIVASTRVLRAGLVLALSSSAAFAQSPASARSPEPARAGWSAAGHEDDFILRNFAFSDGSVLPELRIHYTTLGQPRKDAAGVVRNAVLILHGTTGNGRGFLSPAFAGELFGPGQLLDSATHFIILPDGIGTGKSSKPSDGLRARFPHYGYADMVSAQYELVTRKLGVNHLRLVLGTSMGCMQSWMWAERYPDFMDGAVPLACVPTQIAGRNRMMRSLISQSIRTDPEWRGGNYSAQPHGLMGALEILFMMTSSPLYLQTVAPTRDSADAYIASWIRTRLRTTDANDFLYQFESSSDYDPSRALERIRVPVLAINSADDLVNPPELGLMEHLIKRVANVRFVLLPISEKTRGHGTHSLPAIWKPYLAEFLESLPR
jgi:homoserine O-acetyltransferase